MLTTDSVITRLQETARAPVPGQRVDQAPGDRADSKETERGAAR